MQRIHKGDVLGPGTPVQLCNHGNVPAMMDELDQWREFGISAVRIHLTDYILSIKIYDK